MSAELRAELSWVVQSMTLDLAQDDDAEPRYGRLSATTADTIVDAILDWLGPLLTTL